MVENPIITRGDEILQDVYDPTAQALSLTGSMDLGFTVVGSHNYYAAGTINTAKTIAKPAGATKLLLQAFDQNVRYTLDGTTPTAGIGFQLAVGDIEMIPLGVGTTIKVIAETAGASLQYQFGS